MRIRPLPSLFVSLLSFAGSTPPAEAHFSQAVAARPGPQAVREAPPKRPAPLPEVLWEEIRSTRLDPDWVVEVNRLHLNLGIARLEIDHGTFFFATAVGGRTSELVFLGEAHLVLEPPDDVEASQLELFTGSSRLMERVSEAVLVLASDKAVDAIAAQNRRINVDPGRRLRAEELFAQWRLRAERRLFRVESALFRDALGDPFSAGYFAGWFHSDDLGEFFYRIEPDALEQATLGQFVQLDASAKEKRKLIRQLHRAQRQGQLMGLTVDDLGQWDTWLSASLPGPEGELRPGLEAFKPRHYELDVSLADSDLRLTGRARLHLETLSDVGRIVKLKIFSDLTLHRASLNDLDLFFHQAGSEVLVVLPQTPQTGETVVLEVEYGGRVLSKVKGKTYVLDDTVSWYPHAGTFDLATYDVTFHWPARLDLVAPGRRVSGGREAPDRRVERRRLDLPTFGFSFELGTYRTLTGQAGHVRLTLAFDSLAHEALGKASREELLKTIADSLAYFEEIFGPYPLDELVVVTAPRDFSQSLLGFVTLSSFNMLDVDLITILMGLEDRRTVVAHEIAHQWWGHLVPWQSYRDQWISEAMANYAAILYARNRLGQPLAIGPITGWQEDLTETTADGRAVESLGPLVLGERLVSSHSDSAYQAIVYKKGALVLEMLSRAYGEERFLQTLRALVERVGELSHQPISTSDFVDFIAAATQTDLEGFDRQFIRGTGLPEVYYTYRFEEQETGGWLVKGRARQQSPYRYRYRVVQRDDGNYDVLRQRVDQIEIADSRLVVPVQVAAYNPTVPLSRYHKDNKLDPEVAGNVVFKGHVLVSGVESEFVLKVAHEPKQLWFDRQAEVFGRFFNERRYPKRILYYRGLDVAAAGRYNEAEKLYRQGLSAEAFSGPAMEGGDGGRADKAEARSIDVRIHLQLTRLYLDQGRIAAARRAFSQVKRRLTHSDRYRLANQLTLLEARLAIQEGDSEQAYRLLRKAVLRPGRLGGAEGLALLAIAAYQTGHWAEYEEAFEAAAEKGADLTVLNASPLRR